MKTKFILLLLMIVSASVFAQSVEINPGSGGAIITSSATDKGILVPRMTAVQKDAIASPTAGLLIYQTDATTGFYYYNGTAWTNLGGSGGTASELEKITENFKTGHRILGRNPANYGNIGLEALDLSSSIVPSTTNGAIGTYSVAMGLGTTSSNFYTTALGGYTKALGIASTAMGEFTTASARSSTTMGNNTIAKSHGELALGVNNDTLTTVNPSMFVNDSNRVLTVGNGSHPTLRKTAFVIQQNGNVGINQRRPSEKLDIAGSIKIVDGTQGAGKVLTSDANGKASWQTAAGGGASELEKITEGANTGWRILGRDPDNYGNIGDKAIDLSVNPIASSTRGALGSNSIAMGFQTTASGIVSTAIGNTTTASGHSSIAIGVYSSASGTKSIALGSNNLASGESSTAMGTFSTASAIYSTAMGFSTTASAQYATAMGNTTSASGSISTAMGVSTTASGDISTAMGNGTIAKSYSETALGLFNTDYTPNSSTISNVSDRAFGVGIGTNTNNRKDGLIVYKDGTLAFDKLTTAPTTTADRFYILNNKVHYNGAEVGGGSSSGASELQKIMENGKTGHRILGRNASYYGDIGIAAIDLSISDAESTTRGATGQYSTAMGNNTTASGTSSTAMGISSLASGFASTAMGDRTSASGNYSTAMGQITTASGTYSTAMGQSTAASNLCSTTMGSSTTASGIFSTAMGFTTTASGTASTAMGNFTKAKSFGEVAIGNYNDTLTSVNATGFANDANRIFTVGNGSSTARKTAFVIQQNGRVGIGTGTNAVTKGLVQIDGFVDYNPNRTVGYLNGSGATGSFLLNTNNTPFSIWASDRIASSEFNAFSDKRIKNVIGVSSNKNDLNILAQIRITDYTMKDKVQYGDRAFKKVIAQELKEVYPQAVNISTNTIPSIYQKAIISNGWIALETDVVKGDIVKIITSNGSKEVAVEEVAKGRFKVALPDAEVFIYGKQVSDFHTVDYEALSTLNISATQALLKRIEELEAKNDNLSSQLKEMALLKNDIEAIKASLGINSKTELSAK